MRVLVLTSDAYGARGGIAQYNRDFISALASDSLSREVVVVPRNAPDPVGALPRKVRLVTDGLRSKAAFTKAAMRQVVSKERNDAIVCGHINLLPLAYLASLRHRCPLLLMIYGIDAWQPHRSALTNTLARRAEAVASISQITMDRFAAWATAGNTQSFILPNAIDIGRYSPGPKAPALLNRYGLAGKTILMTVGRLAASERYKGVDEVLGVFADLRAEIPNLAYLVVGDGDDRARLEAKARAVSGSENIVFAGYVGESEKVEHYRLADAYVMPSSGEGFGFVFLEAMACGVPVVASCIDGGKEAVRDGLLGVLVDPKDPNDLKRGIHEALRRPQGVVPEGLDFFSYGNFEERVHRLLKSVVSSTKGTAP